MRKNNEGYALPFVLVVMVIICLVGVSILSASLSNLQNQQASIERMQDQYEAAGRIEKMVAVIESHTTGISEDILLPASKEGEEKVVDYTIVPIKGANDKIEQLMVTFDTKVGTINIICQLSIEAKNGEITSTKDTDNSDLYVYTNPQIEYSSYEILNVGG